MTISQAGAKKVQTGLIGRSIQHSLSPFLHEAEVQALGRPCSYRLFDVEQDAADIDALRAILDYMQEHGYAGCNVTFPVKQRVIPLLDDLSPEAAAMGAVNTVRFTSNGRREGHNTDWWGFGENLRRTIAPTEIGNVCLLGAGGAGAAAAYALTRLGAKRIDVFDADPAKARTLTESLPANSSTLRVVTADDLPRIVGDSDGLVQATPVGMTKLPGAPIDLSLLRPDLWVAEIIYVPIETELLRAARALGARTVDGGGMVMFQAARAIEIFTGLQPSIARMEAHLHTLLAERAVA